MNIYADLPHPILYVLERGLKDSIRLCERMQEFFTELEMPEAVSNWKSNQEYYQEHLDSVTEAIG